MRKALVIGLASAFFVASVALAASGVPKPRTPSLAKAVDGTVAAHSFRYEIEIAVARAGHPPSVLLAHGVTAPGKLFVRVKQGAVVFADGSQVPGPEAAAMIDGPFLYERAPVGVALGGKINWLRVPIAMLGGSSRILTAVRTMTPAPLLRVLGESHATATTRIASKFSGTVRYDDPIVRTAVTHLSGGVEFRDLRVAARIGTDGLVHGISVTGRTADGSTRLAIAARLYAFGRPVQLTPPAEGTFMDKQLVTLAE
jgi:hypothetical protein